MITEPQALAEHFPHGIANRVRPLLAGDGFYFGSRGTKPGFEGIGGVQQLPDCASATARGILSDDNRHCGHDTRGDQDPEQYG